MLDSQLFKRKMLMELIFNPLGLHCFLTDKTYKEATRQVGTSLNSRVSIGVPNTQSRGHRDGFYRVLYGTLPRKR